MITNKEDIQKELAVPFGNNDLEWRIQQAMAGKGKAMAIPYITARAIQIRLDDVMGITNWTDSYDLITYSNSKGGVEYGFKCSLSLRIDGEWVTKQDAAPFTDIEDIKGGCSDALKRAAVKFWIGRDLYKLSEVWVDLLKDRGDNYNLNYYRDRETKAVFYWENPTIDFEEFVKSGVQKIVRKKNATQSDPPKDDAPKKEARPADSSNQITSELKEHYINRISELIVKLSAKDATVFTDKKIKATIKADLHTDGDDFELLLCGCNSEADFRGLEAKFDRLLKG